MQSLDDKEAYEEKEEKKKVFTSISVERCGDKQLGWRLRPKI
jgi:hypothetical protein